MIPLLQIHDNRIINNLEQTTTARGDILPPEVPRLIKEEMTMKRFLSTLLVMLMIVSMMPVTAHAATEWAYVKWANGTRTTYSTFPDEWQAATSSGDNNTVGLLNNWDGGRFVVSEGKTMTVELNGYVVTRDLADSKSDGEVFYVGEKARLNIYVGNKDDLTYGSGNSHGWGGNTVFLPHLHQPGG